METTKAITSQDHLALEKKYGAHDYHPLPVVLAERRRRLFMGRRREKVL